MNWEFLKMPRDSKGRPSAASTAPAEVARPEMSAEQPAADVRLLKSFDSRALGTARESVRSKLDEFEGNLQLLAQLPEQFRLVMAPIENAVNTMALMRNRLDNAEEGLTNEQRRATALTADLAKAQSEIERLGFALRSEEGSASSLREKVVQLDAMVGDLRRDNAEMAGKLARLEPLLRETQAAKDSLEVELSVLKQSKLQADDQLHSLKVEISEARDELANRDNIYAALHQSHTRNAERLEEAQKSIGDLEASLESTNEKLGFAVSALARERNASRGLRSENEQLHKERDEAKHQFEAQMEAARARYDFVEKMLEESRARFHEETRQLSVSRRERIERDRDISRLTLALEAAQREIAEIKAQAASATESASSSSNLLAAEIEQRRKAELEVDMLRAENSSLNLKQKSLSETARSNLAMIAEATAKFQSKITTLRTENEQLRAELHAARNQGPKDVDEELDFLLKEQGKENKVVPIR